MQGSLFGTNILKAGIVSIALCTTALTTTAFAADNPLSVHVLNLQDGLPSKDVTVTLEQQQKDGWKKLNQGVTNEQGRITAL